MAERLFGCIGLIVFTVGMLFQIPKFVAIYDDLGVALPVGTRMVISIPGAIVLLVALGADLLFLPPLLMQIDTAPSLSSKSVPAPAETPAQ